jgi:tRNA pseudouridine55 synthase
MDGFLNLNKPAGFTSHDCVAKLRRLLRTKKIGHGGTLDPAATGVLPIAVGRATRLLQYLDPDKAYQATIRLGMQTTTDDLEGEVLHQTPASHITLEAVQAALPQFIGQIQQIPPHYSAIQVGGQRLYDLARAGQALEVPARSVRVDAIELIEWAPGEFGHIQVAIACGPGTYIRSIARDLGAALGVGGTLATLLRTRSCGLDLSGAVTFEQVEAETAALINPPLLLRHLPQLVLEADLARRFCQGQKLPLAETELAARLRENTGFPPDVPDGVELAQKIGVDEGDWTNTPDDLLRLVQEERVQAERVQAETGEEEPAEGKSTQEKGPTDAKADPQTVPIQGTIIQIWNESEQFLGVGHLVDAKLLDGGDSKILRPQFVYTPA